MSLGPEELRRRTKSFALRVVKLFQALPRSPEAAIMGKQLLRSSTSVAANYRAACRARSRPEFASRIGVVVEESDESAFWLELLSEAGIVPAEKLGNLRDEANELTAICTATRQSVRNNKA